MINNNIKYQKILEKLSSNIYGPLSIPTYNKKRYFLILLDIKIRYVDIYLIQNKLKVKVIFKKYKNKKENLANSRIEIFNINDRRDFLIIIILYY